MGNVDGQFHSQSFAHGRHETDLNKKLNMKVGGVSQRIHTRGDIHWENHNPRIIAVESIVLALVDDFAVVFDTVLLSDVHTGRLTTDTGS